MKNRRFRKNIFIQELAARGLMILFYLKPILYIRYLFLNGLYTYAQRKGLISKVKISVLLLLLAMMILDCRLSYKTSARKESNCDIS